MEREILHISLTSNGYFWIFLSKWFTRYKEDFHGDQPVLWGLTDPSSKKWIRWSWAFSTPNRRIPATQRCSMSTRFQIFTNGHQTSTSKCTAPIRPKLSNPTAPILHVTSMQSASLLGGRTRSDRIRHTQISLPISVPITRNSLSRHFAARYQNSNFKKRLRYEACSCSRRELSKGAL